MRRCLLLRLIDLLPPLLHTVLVCIIGLPGVAAGIRAAAAMQQPTQPAALWFRMHQQRISCVTKPTNRLLFFSDVSIGEELPSASGALPLDFFQNSRHPLDASDVDRCVGCLEASPMLTEYRAVLTQNSRPCSSKVHETRGQD